MHDDYDIYGHDRADAYAEELAEATDEKLREIAADTRYPKGAALAARELRIREEDFYRQQAAEIAAETNIPQHLVW